MYNEKLLDEFFNPVNVGVIKGADAVGKVKDRNCGDIVKIYISVKDDRITDVKFQTYGSTVSIAASSVATKLIINKTLDEAYAVNADTLKTELGEVPESKGFALSLVESAIHMALNSYLKHTLGYIPEKYKAGEIANSDMAIEEDDDEVVAPKKNKVAAKKPVAKKASAQKVSEKTEIEDSDIIEDDDIDDEDSDDKADDKLVAQQAPTAPIVTKTTSKTVEVYTRDLDDEAEEDKLFGSFDNLTSTLSDALKKLNDENE